jgi:hypothetical protein
MRPACCLALLLSISVYVEAQPSGSVKSASGVQIPDYGVKAMSMRVAELVASDGPKSYQPRMGVSVAISGNTVVAGAPAAQIGNNAGQGAAYVFVKPQTGWKSMQQVAKLTASDGAYQSGLGGSVAISGNVIVAGAPSSNAAYLFIKPASGWIDMTETAKLTASDGQYGDLFGNAVAISDNTIAVGALGVNQMTGKAYVFVMPQGGWVSMTQTAELTPSNPLFDGIFGTAISISGDTVTVGAPYKNLAYVFVKPLGGWTNVHQSAILSPTDAIDFDLFGYSVSVSGNTVVVGKPSTFNSGSAYVFVEPSGGWTDMTQTAELRASDGTVEDYLGSSVFTNGQKVLVGAMLAFQSNGSGGAAYVYVKPGGGWTDTSAFNGKLTTATGLAVGASVAASGTTTVVGAPSTNIGTDVNSPGAAYVFTPSR